MGRAIQRNVVKRPAALRDLDELADYLSMQSHALEMRFLRAAELTFERLAEMAEMGSPCEFRIPEATNLRTWSIKGFRNHIIYYRPIPSGIEVYRVLHGSRDVESAFEES